MSVTVTSIRQVHKDLTRERILQTAVELMAERMDTDIPISDIAVRSGVTERTIYRHFLSRDQLTRAVWPLVVARLQSRPAVHRAAELVELPHKVFPELTNSAALVRAAVYSDVARETSQETSPARQAAMLDCVRDALPDLDAAAQRRRAAIALALSSAYGWAVLQDFGGLDAAEAAEASSEAIAILLGLAPVAGAASE